VRRVQELLGTDGAHVVLEVTGVPAAFAEAIALAGAGGTVVSVGNLNVGAVNEVPVSPGIITRKNLSILGCLRYDPWYLHEALTFLERTHDRYPFTELTDRDYRLDEIHEAIERGGARQVARAGVVPAPHSAMGST